MEPGKHAFDVATGGLPLGGLATPGGVTRTVMRPQQIEEPAFWSVAADTTDEAMVGVGSDGRVNAWNNGARLLFGHTRPQAMGLPAGALFVDSCYREPGIGRLLFGAGTGLARAQGRRRDGTTLPVSVRAARLPDGPGVCLFVRDLTALVEAERQRDEAVTALQRQNALWDLLQRMTRIATDAVDLTDALHRCTLEFCSRFDWPFGHALLLGRSDRVESHIWYLADQERYSALRRALEDSGPNGGLTGVVLEARQPVWLPALPASAFNGAGPLAEAAGLHSGFAFPVALDDQVVATVELLGPRRSGDDGQLLACARHGSVQLGRVLERERSRRALSHQAMHDALTDLPNRILFLDRLAQAVRGLRRGGPHLAVLFIDLDDFKLINDSLGHETGDHVLKTVARRLLEVTGPADTVARFGGDEFIILSERLPDAEAVGDIANRVLEALSVPILLDGSTSTVVTGSIGIAIAGSPDAQPEHLIRDSDAAMYRAKEEGRGRFNVFDRRLHERASLKLSIANELRRAVARGQFRLVYQPQFRMSDGRLIGVEALARWDNPDRGTLSPADWIPVAEENHLIVPIGEWVVAEACAMTAEWLKLLPGGTDDAGFKVGVNVSAVQLARPELVDGVVSALRRTGVDPSRLCIEVTESVLMAAPGTYLEALLGLKMVGLSIAVDDFGTGYSSLAYLRRFPIDVIKVDKGFIDGLGLGDQRGRAILRAVVQLSEALGVVSVAEGVETEEQAQVLVESGCFAAQGFYFGRPQCADDITRLLAAQA